MRLPAQFSALNEPLYLRYWLGSVASVGGSQLLFIGQGSLIQDLTKSPLYLGYLGAASALPSIALSLFGGALADRFDKRRVLMAISAATFLLLALLTLLDASGTIQVWHVLTIAALTSLVQGLDMPTRGALFPHLIARSNMGSAVAMNSIVWQGTRMIMPALGGVLLVLSSTAVLFGLAALGAAYMFFVLATLSLEVPGQRHTSAVTQMVEGFRYVARTRLFLILIGLAYASSFFGISYTGMMPALSEQLGAGKAGFGLLVSATGVGSVLGTLSAPFLTSEESLGKRILLGAGGSASCIMTLGMISEFADVIPNAYYVAIAVAILGSLLGSFFFVSSMTVLQLAVPDDLRGRVMGVHAVNFSLMSLGALFTGGIATLVGTGLAVSIAASLYLAAVGYVALTQTAFTRLAPTTSH